MKINFNPPRARIVAVAVAAWMVWTLLTRHVHLGVIDFRLPYLGPVHVIAALAIVCITIVGLARLYRDGW
jgi:hypothetical protein